MAGKRSWVQLRLATLLGLVTLSCLAMGWRQHRVKTLRHKQETLVYYKKLGAQIETRPSRPLWLGQIVGKELHQDVVSVKLEGRRIRDIDLERLGEMPELRRLYLARTSISDDGVKHIARLPELRRISLWNTKITSKGLAHLRGLVNLEALDMHSSKVDDEGLAHLSI